jgi:type II secretory pathway component PulJ
MISLTIGATVTSAGFTLYLQMSKNRNLIQAELNLQSNSYFIHQTFRQFFNQAGYRPLNSTTLNSSILPIKAPQQAFEAVDGQWAAGEFIRVLNNGFALRFEGSSDVTNVADDSLFNCQGEPIAAGDVADVQFSIVNGTLSCTSAGVVVEMISNEDDINVEQFVINWGVDTNNDSNVDEFRPSTMPLAANESLMAVRLSLLLSSKNEVQSIPQSYIFNETEHTSTDTRLRRESITTVILKN